MGVLTRGKLCNLLHDFPGERGKFEELVHNLMEDSVNHHLVPCHKETMMGSGCDGLKALAVF